MEESNRSIYKAILNVCILNWMICIYEFVLIFVWTPAYIIGTLFNGYVAIMLTILLVKKGKERKLL